MCDPNESQNVPELDLEPDPESENENNSDPDSENESDRDSDNDDDDDSSDYYRYDPSRQMYNSPPNSYDGNNSDNDFGDMDLGWLLPGLMPKKKKIRLEELGNIPTTFDPDAKALSMFENKLFCDVTFQVPVEPNASEEKMKMKLFEAHKLILAINSEVFCTMFNGSLPETESPIKIADVPAVAFENMLRFIYARKIDFGNILVSETNTSFKYDGSIICISILYAAKKYMIENLIRICLNYLYKNLHDYNTCSILACAHMCDEKDLLEMAQNKFKRNFLSVVQFSDFRLIPEELLLGYLKELSFKARAMDLFRALVGWAKKHTSDPDGNIREKLDPYLPFVHFLTLTAKEFKNEVVQAKEQVFTKEELAGMVEFFDSDKTKKCTYPPWCSKVMVHTPSQSCKAKLCTQTSLWGKGQSILPGAKAVCEFSVKDEKLSLKGFYLPIKQDDYGLFLINVPTCLETLTVSLEHTTTEQFTATKGESGPGLEVLYTLPQPIELVPRQKYKLSVNIPVGYAKSFLTQGQYFLSPNAIGMCYQVKFNLKVSPADPKDGVLFALDIVGQRFTYAP